MLSIRGVAILLYCQISVRIDLVVRISRERSLLSPPPPLETGDWHTECTVAAKQLRYCHRS